MRLDIAPGWRTALAAELEKPYFATLSAYVDSERASHEVFPPEPDVFNAFRHADFDQTRVLLLGQDPYHDVGQAHGLCFSVRPGVKFPASLRNIFKERQSDVGLPPPQDGCLTGWAGQGILMLNTVLTVRAHEAASHKGKGWEVFTDAVICALNARPAPVVFVLWGGHAQNKRRLITHNRHVVLESAHPSPLSAHSGFFGSRPFSRINESLRSLGQPEIDWGVIVDDNVAGDSTAGTGG